VQFGIALVHTPPKKTCPKGHAGATHKEPEVIYPDMHVEHEGSLYPVTHVKHEESLLYATQFGIEAHVYPVVHVEHEESVL